MLTFGCTTSVQPEIDVAALPEKQNYAAVQRELANLNFETKSNENGEIWSLVLCEQDDVGDDTLSVVRHLPHLQQLILIYDPIRGDGLAHLKTLSKLEHLDLYATQIDDSALKHLEKITTLKYLDIRSLNVDENGILKSEFGNVSDLGLRSISKLPNLEQLLIAGTVTDTGLQQLAELSKLKYIEIHSENVTDDGIAWLEIKFPGIEIGR